MAYMIKEEYMQWLKDTRQGKHELIDVFIKNKGEIEVKKKMAWFIEATPKDWGEFCKITGRKYECIFDMNK